MLIFTKLLYTTTALNFTSSFYSGHATNVPQNQTAGTIYSKYCCHEWSHWTSIDVPTETNAIDGHSDNRWFFQNDLIKNTCMYAPCMHIHSYIDRLKTCVVQISICSNHPPKIKYVDNYLHGTLWLDQVRYNPWPVQEQIVDHSINTSSFPLLMNG